MREIFFSADRLVAALLNLPKEKNVCLLDSCGAGHLDSHLLIAGFNPVEIMEITGTDADKTLEILNRKLSAENLFAIFTLAYDFGLKLENIQPRPKEFSNFDEPDIFLALFDCLIIHDYDARKTFLIGDENKFDRIQHILSGSPRFPGFPDTQNSKISSNFSEENYIAAVEKIKERIRRGDTYQTNLTRQIRAELPENLTPGQIFRHLRKNHPAPFAALLHRKNDTVISASPERFFSIAECGTQDTEFSARRKRVITTSPIKGTRPRGKTVEEDLRLKQELINSEKDRAENVMIVDLLRNDLGRICKFGSIRVEKLCELQQHPTFFHLVSTVSGELPAEISFSEIIKAVFPCGSITGAPKIRTMQIIDEIETAPRALSMGAIGYSIRNLRNTALDSPLSTLHSFDLSVAIRTMVIRGREAIFNVGGGIVIDSVAEREYEETITKTRALLSAIRGKFT
ncbi:MAG TPA: anthranilate synthase component I family protein [Pyrinomonadaceae bacterium]|nr:anthranilate synthase component I family protein [Pyrinomonadaceae bacterium]